jgi:hypothetical protein
MSLIEKLRAPAMCLMLAAATMIPFNGCKVKIQNTYNIINSPTKESEDKNAKKGLESYFLQGDELRSIETSSERILNQDEVYNQHTSEEGETESGPKTILEEGVGNYIIPKTDDSPETRNLIIRTFEFGSEKDRKDFENNITNDIPYLLLAKDNVLTLIEPSIKSSESLSPEQKIIYDGIIDKYIKRTGAESVSGKDLTERNDTELSTIQNYDTQSTNIGNVPAGNSNLGNAPANIITGKGLENYLFQGNELRFLELFKGNVSYHHIEEGGAISIPDELFIREFNSNPVKIMGGSGEGSIKEFFDKYKIEEFDWAEYIIPEREPFSTEHNLTLFLFKFKGEQEAKQFLVDENTHTRSPAFIKGNMMSVIYSPTFEFVYEYNMLSSEQKIIYMDLIFAYKDRTKMDLILSNDEDKNESNLRFLNDLRKKYSWELRTN